MVVRENLMQLGESSVCVLMRWDVSDTEYDQAELTGEVEQAALDH